MPPKNFFRKFSALRWLLRPFWGLKTSLESLRFTAACTTTNSLHDHMHAWRFTHGLVVCPDPTLAERKGVLLQYDIPPDPRGV